MGFGTIVTSAIMIILSLIIVIFVATNIISWIDYIGGTTSYVAKEVNVKLNVILKITGVQYNSTLNIMIINVTNVGSESIILGPRTDIILDYIDVNGIHRVELLKPSSWEIYKAYIGNTTISVPSGVYIELTPGITVSIKASPSYSIRIGSVVKVVVASPIGVKTEYAFIPT